jgi:rhodanese-related sulfurtransferase
MGMRSVTLLLGLVAGLAMGASDMTPETLLEKQAKREPVVVLDVRTSEEYAEGHVPGAINISHTEIAERLQELSAYKQTPVVVYCRSGRRAGIAIDVLEHHGFSKVFHLAGDMNGWREAHRPEEK